MSTSTTKTADQSWRPDLRSPLVMSLGLLLALQLLIALGLSLSKPGLSALTPQTPMIALAPKGVTEITIEGGDGTDSLTLSRKGDDAWVIADLADLPVTTDKVDQLLTTVTGLKRPLPVGTTEEARKRFKVADDDFVRRLTLETKDGKTATLILGETPSFRHLFGRTAGDQAVYDLPLALADVSNRRDDWTQKDLLTIDQEKLQSIQGKDWTLTKTDAGWRLKDSQEPLSEDAAQKLVTTLAGLRYRGVLGIKDDPAYQQDTPLLELGLALADGSTRTYRLSKAKDSEDYVLKSSAQPYYFKLSKYDLEGVLDVDRSTLIVQPKQPEEAAKPSSDEPKAQAPAARPTASATGKAETTEQAPEPQTPSDQPAEAPEVQTAPEPSNADSQ